ncbi:hypothetical protein B0T26DRAFT_673918 [Lasiosphaeria miniovina]|uniref:Uncharacterized protein n=1 Tax=Lasiosphaeria miniovina TaxID=1954250 RepID=A0AA40AUE1_9PEZI|nr:uncharacterized protein B0T26DRAFT_673918 [Lasiosphaeria miniovina]KAK0722184.1 hypothetical protein B0T26DRAFT_673918 [Lasiosphaeria miniovina]
MTVWKSTKCRLGPTAAYRTLMDRRYRPLLSFGLKVLLGVRWHGAALGHSAGARISLRYGRPRIRLSLPLFVLLLGFLSPDKRQVSQQPPRYCGPEIQNQDDDDDDDNSNKN